VNSLTLTTVEVHAEGEPGRVVLDAADLVQGETMAERFAWCRGNLHWLRELLLREPRGYPRCAPSCCCPSPGGPTSG